MSLSLLIALFLHLTNVSSSRRLSRSYPNDISINKLTDDGEVSQVIYASRAVDKSRPKMAFIFDKDDISSSSCIKVFRYSRMGMRDTT